MSRVKCDYHGCDLDSVGYVDRSLQGPFYCPLHREWAEDVVYRYWVEIDNAMREEHEP